jgi:hypothetical protein
MVNYGECRSVGLRWLDISLFSRRLDHGTTLKPYCRSQQARHGPLLPKTTDGAGQITRQDELGVRRARVLHAVRADANGQCDRTCLRTSSSWNPRFGPTASDGVAKLVCQGWRGREDHFYFAHFRRRALVTTLPAPQPISETDAHALLEATMRSEVSLPAAVNHAA